MKIAKKTLAILMILALVLALPVLAEGEESYRDVPADAWYARAVEYCAARGLMQGVGDGVFNPGGGTTRAMVVTVLYRLAGTPARQTAEPFPDVAADSWYAESVVWAALAGITTGRTDGTFGPDVPITREDLAVFLWRSLGCPAALTADEPFTDEAEISAYALEAVRWAKAAGIVNGMEDGSFAPRKGATRAELATVLMRLDRRFLGIDLGIIDLRPSGLASDGEGGILVTDTYHKCIWLVKDGEPVLLAGADTVGDLYGEPTGGYVDDVPEVSCFRQPWAIVSFLEGWVVSDTANNALRYYDPEGVQTVNAAPGEKDLPVGDYGVTYERPTGLAQDEEGNLYAADTGAGAIRLITPEGKATTFAEGLDEPTGLCWYAGSLYVAETGANRILKITGGAVEVLAGSGEEGFLDGAAMEACFSSPMGVAVDGQGRVFVADTVNSAVRCIADGQVVTLLHAEPDTPLNSPISPVGLLVTEEGLYVADNFTGQLLCIGIG